MILFEILETIDNLKQRVRELEKELSSLKKQRQKEKTILRSHLTRIKTQQELSFLMIMDDVNYVDLSPRKAIETYRDPDKDFIILDITEEDDRGDIKLDGTIHIPYSQLEDRLSEIDNKFTPLMVISKKGIKSILACEMLAKNGFLNVNNVSGGYLLWGRSENSLFKIAA